MDDSSLVDSFGRVARKLRISVTDRCNFRCTFCMPNEPVWMPREEILSFEEIIRVTRVLVSMGINKVRLTGGEPLVRKEIEKLVEGLTNIEGINSMSMTTNGFFLPEKALQLKEAGLKSVTVSCHSMKPERFADITGRQAYERIWNGIKAAKEVGLHPIKINAVIIRGCNDDEIVDLASLAHGTGFTVRFIEYMPFDGNKLWGLDKVVTKNEIIERIREEYELVPLEREVGSTAQLYAFADAPGEIGVISSISEPFCGDCDRIRLTADGKLVPCMWDHAEHDLKPLLRNGASDEEISTYIGEMVALKAEGVGALLEKLTPLEHVRPMHTLGG